MVDLVAAIEIFIHEYLTTDVLMLQWLFNTSFLVSMLATWLVHQSLIQCWQLDWFYRLLIEEDVVEKASAGVSVLWAWGFTNTHKKWYMLYTNLSLEKKESVLPKTRNSSFLSSWYLYFTALSIWIFWPLVHNADSSYRCPNSPLVPYEVRYMPLK